MSIALARQTISLHRDAMAMQTITGWAMPADGPGRVLPMTGLIYLWNDLHKQVCQTHTRTPPLSPRARARARALDARSRLLGQLPKTGGNGNTICDERLSHCHPGWCILLMMYVLHTKPNGHVGPFQVLLMHITGQRYSFRLRLSATKASDNFYYAQYLVGPGGLA